MLPFFVLPFFLLPFFMFGEHHKTVGPCYRSIVLSSIEPLTFASAK